VFGLYAPQENACLKIHFNWKFYILEVV